MAGPITVQPFGTGTIDGIVKINLFISAGPVVNYLQNPMTTLGDSIYGGVSGISLRLPIGSSNQVYTVTGGIPSWQTLNLASLGAQPQLNGTGFVKAAGTSISYDNSTYQTVISLTTLGTSGAATLIGSTLNIPNYISGITNTAANNELMKSNGTNAIPSGIFSISAGNINLGYSSLSGDRYIIAESLSANNNLIFQTTNGSSSAADNFYVSNSGGGTPTSNLTASLSGGFVIVSKTRLNGQNIAGDSFFPFSSFTTGLSLSSNTNTSSNIVQSSFRAQNSKTGSAAAAGLGVGIDYGLSNASSTNIVSSSTQSIFTTATGGAESADYVINNISGGSLTERFRIKADGTIIAGTISYTTITTSGNWSNLTAGYYKDKYGATHLKGGIIISSTNFPGVGAATAASAIPNATNNSSYSVPVYRANGSYYVGSAGITISNLGQIIIDGFITTAAASTTGTVGANVTLSGTDDIVIFLDGITYL